MKKGRKIQLKEFETIANLIVKKFRDNNATPDVFNGIWSIQLGDSEICLDYSNVIVYPETISEFTMPVIVDEHHVIDPDTFEAIQRTYAISAPLYGVPNRVTKASWDGFKIAWNNYLESMGVTWDDWQIEMAILWERDAKE